MTYTRAAVFAALVLATGCESKKKAAPAPATGSGSAAIVEKDLAAPVASPGSAEGSAAAPTESDAAPTGSDVPRDDDKPGTTKGRIDKYREKFKTDHPKTDAPKTP